MRLFAQACSAMTSTRAPASPLVENSISAAASKACRVRSASRSGSGAALLFADGAVRLAFVVAATTIKTPPLLKRGSAAANEAGAPWRQSWRRAPWARGEKCEDPSLSTPTRPPAEIPFVQKYHVRDRSLARFRSVPDDRLRFAETPLAR